ncbi:metallophosphoesterase family protein [soil metagenome]
MPKRWAISDVHGCAKTFKQLLDRLELQPDDYLYLLGDYINKGPRSKKVLKTIIKLKEDGHKIRCLMGNHEDLLLRALEDPLLIPMFNQHGGKETLKSFKVKSINDIPTEYINFFHSLEYYIELEDFVLVHSTLNFLDKNPFTDRHAMLWTKGNRIIPAKIQYRRIIHGHTPTKLNVIKNGLKKPKNYALCIDAGCVYNGEELGNLVALNLDTFELLVQKNEEEAVVEKK